MQLSSFQILVIASCALAAAGSVRYLIPGLRRSHFVAVLIWMTLFPILLIGAFVFWIPWVERIPARILIDRDPFFSAMVDHYPETRLELERLVTECRPDTGPEFQDFVGGLIDVRRMGRQVRSEAFRKGQHICAPYFQRSLPYASDEALDRYVRLQLEIMVRTKNHSDQLAYWAALGKPGPNGEPLPYLAPELQERLNDAMAEVVRSAEADPADMPGREEFLESVHAVFAKVEHDRGGQFLNQIELLDKPRHSAAERPVVASLVFELYRAATRLPVDQRRRAVRAVVTLHQDA